MKEPGRREQEGIGPPRQAVPRRLPWKLMRLV